ncbi:hypothetical protein AAZX31_04G228300 [Glycine max]|nr:hypothetical protein GYH30_011014 [Glycine max]KRH64649.2 hypothetical protein GLYMA_04G248100v4 [Glycine max]
MGCGGSKVEDFPAVVLCRERKAFLKAASEQRYALAAAHVAYFRSLREIGDALHKFAEQDLTTTTTGSSSPVLTLPSETKSINNKLSSSSPSISHADSPNGSHLPLSSGSELSSPSHSSSPHIHDSPESDPPPYGYYQNYHYAHYMKRSVPRGKPMVYEEPERHVATNGQWPDPSYGHANTGFYGFPGGDYPYYPPPGPSYSPPRPPPAPPSPPRVSTWDFLNFFDNFDNGYPSYPPRFGSSASSPDSKEVREREGIPELEEETEHEIMKEKEKEVPLKKEKKKVGEQKGFGVVGVRDFGEGPSNTKTVPLQQVSSSEGSSKTVRFHDGSDNGSVEKEIKSSPDTVASEERGAKKGVSFEIDEATVTTVDGDSSVLSSVTTLSAHGTRDLLEVVEEIQGEFVTASNFGKEVALLLEVCKPPYRSRVAALRVIFSRILQMVAPSRLPSDPLSIQFSSREIKLAQAYCGEPGKEFKTNPENLSSTLEKLYAWEKKLYKEVKVLV